jgi:hypothetical protein
MVYPLVFSDSLAHVRGAINNQITNLICETQNIPTGKHTPTSPASAKLQRSNRHLLG